MIPTRHNGFNSIEAVERIAATTVTNVVDWLGGRPLNLVSGPCRLDRRPGRHAVAELAGPSMATAIRDAPRVT